MDFSVLPMWYQVSTVAVFGLIIGSFLNVYIYRFNTGKSLNGSSHCLSCGHKLRWFDLLPVFSYLYLRGRCRYCSSFVSLRYVLVELLTASTFVLVFLQFNTLAELFLLLCFMSVLIVVFVYDLYHLIIPNKLVLVLSALALGMLVFTGFATNVLVQLITTVLASGFFAVLWLVSGGRWIGLGDAKLAIPLSLLLAPASAFSFVVLSFWVGAGVSLTLLAIQFLLKRGQYYLPRMPIHFTIKSEVPFAPFIIISFVLVYFFGVNVLEQIEWFFFKL